jgi:hypothetical protein
VRSSSHKKMSLRPELPADASPIGPVELRDLSSAIQTGSGQTYNFTFTAPGTYQYDCAVHGQMMTGTIVVLAAATSPPVMPPPSTPPPSTPPPTGY